VLFQVLRIVIHALVGSSRPFGGPFPCHLNSIGVDRAHRAVLSDHSGVRAGAGRALVARRCAEHRVRDMEPMAGSNGSL